MFHKFHLIGVSTSEFKGSLGSIVGRLHA